MGTEANILVGAASSVKFGAYVTAKGAATLSDVGFTAGGVMFDPKAEHHEVMVDQNLGILAAIPKKRELELKMKLLEATPENIRIGLGQPAANVTGTSPDYTLYADASAGEQYHQIQIIAPGLGTNATRTITFWRAYVKEMAQLTMQKDAEQAVDLTIGVCEETTGSGSDSWFKVVET